MDSLSSIKIIIGLTGSFSSGCKTASGYLGSKGYEVFSLSDKIDEHIRENNIIPSRNNKQDVGNTLRKDKGEDYLSKETFEKIKNREPKLWENNKIIIKSFRNDREVLFFKNHFRQKFILFNIDAPRELRWKRTNEGRDIKEHVDKRTFEVDDERDSGEEFSEGQQVRKCVDLADVVINNIGAKEELHSKLNKYLDIIENNKTFRIDEAPDMERFMNESINKTLFSNCYKRQVGAVVVKDKNIIGKGCNGTPEGISPCAKIKKCYRETNIKCKECGVPLQFTFSKCIKCGKLIDLRQKEELGKHLDLCRALHAEERAVIGALLEEKKLLNGCKLYTTTFPCLLCTKVIIESKISEVIYLDPYPFRESWTMLESGNIGIEKFEGFLKDAYSKIYIS